MSEPSSPTPQVLAGYDRLGRIPFTLRIGVTGHRKLDHPEVLVPLVEGALRQLKELIAGSAEAAIGLVVVSSLAEGADRLVAETVLGVPESRLEVALPVPVDDYCRDFSDPDSQKQFHGLLGRASERWTAPASSSRDEAYEQAGKYVVDRSDVLIALWDGEPARGQGGTAAIVGYARQRQVPLVWVKTSGIPVIVTEFDTPSAGVLREAVRELDEYNAAVIPTPEFARRVEEERNHIDPAILVEEATAPLVRSINSVADWIVPYFVRADVLALRLQRRFRILSAAMFVMAAAAVTIVAVQANFLPTLNWLAGIEVVLLVALLAIPLLSRRSRLHDRWISYRFLAERLRSAYFLALAGTGDRRDRSARLAYLSDSTEAWIERALAEVIVRRPQTTDGLSDLDSLRSYLIKAWIGGQVAYHRHAAHFHHKWDTRLLYSTAILFSITLVAAIAHMLGVAENGAHTSNWAVLVIVLSISIPAIGGALHGIGTQSQFRHHAGRYRRMIDLLTELEQQLEQAGSMEQLRQGAAETERVMREENSDWFGVMRFHDMELIT
jgi:hypothetical protein